MRDFEGGRGPGPLMSLGHAYEKRVLGTFFTKSEKAYKDAIAIEAQRLKSETERFRREDGFRIVREFYGGDPKNPAQQIARDIRLAVAEQLELEDDADIDRLLYYTAVGTPLDEYHGIDAWIEYKDSEGQVAMATLDVTLNKEKMAFGHKADVLIGEIPDAQKDEDGYLEIIDSCAEQIANSIQRQLEGAKRQQRRAS